MPIPLNPFYNGNSANNVMDASTEQFERDLQLLTEKSLIVVNLSGFKKLALFCIQNIGAYVDIQNRTMYLVFLVYI